MTTFEQNFLSKPVF